MKLMLVGSSGGHLTQLMLLEPWWELHDRHWVTFPTLDAMSKLARESVTWAAYPTTRNIPNLLRNIWAAFGVFRRERPDVVISTGAGVAVAYFWVARLFRVPTVYLEVFDRIDTPTLTGRLVRPVTDLFCVQWPEQMKFYKGSTVVGQLW